MSRFYLIYSLKIFRIFYFDVLTFVQNQNEIGTKMEDLLLTPRNS
jgi:hypothetical protein